MKRLQLSIALNAAADGAAPERVELIPAGPQVTGRDGRHWLFDADAAAQVLSAFTARNIELPIDWEHATQRRAPNGEAAPAAAWIRSLSIDDGALWGSVDWTPRGSEQVANREYRYLSPVFDYEPATGRIARLVSAGLTNAPNLHVQALNQEESPMTRSALLLLAIAGLGLAATADDDAIASAINQQKADADTARALNAEKAPSLDRYVPRADYDALVARATNAENSVKARDAAEHTGAVEAAITGALTAGKITPATADYHRASCSDGADLERFKAFVTATPVVGADTTSFGKQPDGKVTALNAEQKDACRLLGIPEDKFVETLQAK